MKTTTNRGGKRKGAGAPPRPFLEKKSQVNVRFSNKIINHFGGKDNLRQVIIKHIESLCTLLINVPNFEGVRIHPGDSEKDLEDANL